MLLEDHGMIGDPQTAALVGRHGDAPWALPLAGAAVSTAAVAAAAAGAPAEGAFGRGLLELLVVGVPIAAGLYALRAPVNRRFGLALLAIGFGWSLTALSESALSIPYTIGRLSTWFMFPCVVALLLAFPDGRVARGLDRLLLAFTIVLLLVLFVGTAPLVTQFPPHTLWASCTTDCPANALSLVDRPPAFMPTLILVREWGVELLWLGLFWSMARRWRAASPLHQDATTPVFVAGAAMGVVHIAFHTARQLGAPAHTVVTLSEVWTFCIVGVCLAVWLGLVRRRMLLAGSLARLGVALRRSDDPASLRDAIAAALSDSTMQLLYRDEQTASWRDTAGRAVSWPRPLPAARAATPIATGDGAGELVLIHDPALRDDQELLDGVEGMVLAGWRQERLAADLGRAIGDLEESRRRIAEAAELERARIGRDLHDGAQTRLVALRIRLGVVEERLEDNPRACARELHELGFEAERALEELRSLAHGIHPSLLTDRGIVDAVRSVAGQAPVPVQVVATGVTRHRLELESAVYFTCAEAIQNAVKHASGPIGVWVTLSQTPHLLRFEVRDDGPGFAGDRGDGHGIRNMHDRIEALGGRLSVESQPGRGTTVRGSIGLP
jgi:signal transduction histidine kinase